MRLRLKNKTAKKRADRIKKKQRVRKKIFGTAERPRLCVYKSLRYITAQIVDDDTSKTLISMSTKDLKSTNNLESAKALGKEFGKKVLDTKVKAVVFDRNGFLYHGRIKAFADAAREAGLQF
ncbi:MAG: 50S ribosomal protein L18 [Bdellovibrionota bacterium]